MAGQQIDEIRSELARSKESLLDKAKAPVVTAYLKTHPGTAIGAALLAGFVMGISAKGRNPLAEVVVKGLQWDMLRRVCR